METCVFAVFEFISGLVESRQLRDLLPPILPTLTLHLISHMQPTHSQVERWLGDVAQFVDEEEQIFSYSVRLSAHDLLEAMWEEPSLRNHTHSAITAAVEKHLQTTRSNSSPNAWKIEEACMLALGCVIMTPNTSFSAQQFTESVVMSTLQSPSGNPLLLGRSLWLAGKMAGRLKPGTLDQLLQSLVTALLPTQHSVLRVLAAKATCNFCSELQATNCTSRLLPILPSLISLLAAMTADLPDIVLLVVIDTLQLVTRVDESVTARHALQLSEVALSLFLKHSHDPGLSSSLEDLFSVLANNPGCHADFHRSFLPSAVQLLESNETGISLGLLPAVLDVLVLLVRGCGLGNVPNEVVREIFPRVVRVGVASDDVAMLQNAGECVRAFVSMAMEDLVQWCDREGESGVLYVVRLAVHLLDPSRPESSAAFIGRLLIVFFKKVGGMLGDHLQLLLRSVLSKMQSVKTASVMQSLLLVYAYLLQTELEAVVSFLCQVPDPRGQPALNYVLKEWTSQHPFFFGSFETRLSTVALCQLLSHCVTTGNNLLCSVVVEEEEDNGCGLGVQTRAQKTAAGVTRKTAIPLPVKIVRLLVSDLQSHLEASAESEGSECSAEEEGNEEVREMESLLTSEDGESEEFDKDPELHGDPLLQMDLQAHLVKYLGDICQLPSFSSSIRPHLRPYELVTLHSAGIHTN
ncbi:Importin-9 [Geodia barretti]|nr:Importin-9 [Geodia barretti]